jgi:tetratricopeptide (TPR) repeat protein
MQDMASLDLGRKDYETARSRLMKALELLQKAGDRTGEASVLSNLGHISMEKNEFQRAREDFLKALQIMREIGDRSGEAAILHNLGLIESQVDAKKMALEDFEQSLHIYQQMADRPGEAGAFFQLGALAMKNDKIPEGLRLMALSAIILRSIKSDEVGNVEPLVERLASKLSYNQEQFVKMVQEVLQSYRMDRGRSLVKKAFEGLA